ncbi:kinase-like domain-containing protein, partial [Thelephora terrestris]
ALVVLRRLCGTFQQLPGSCLIGGELMIDGGIPFAKRAYADLRKGIWRGENVAIKVLRISTDESRAEITKRFCKEMVLWKQLHHKNLLPFYGACMGNQFGMVSPWLESGNIIGFTRKNSEANRLNLLIDVANGLEYLHHSGVIHGNLRGSNILISNPPSPHALLCDYGLTSIVFDPFSLTRESINWTAPELLTVENDRRGPSLTGDIYAFAMVLTGSPPFAHRQKPEVAVDVVLEGKRPPRPKNSESLGITNEIWNLLEMCWAKNVASRPKVGQVVAYLNRVAKNWTADATAFLLASSAGFQEVMSMEPEKVQKIADDIDQVRKHVQDQNN